MRLYFMRHGYAEPAIGKPDEERELTADGVNKVQTAAVVIERLALTPLRIYCSPRKRATQTAQIVAKALNTSLEIDDAVNFGFDVLAAGNIAAKAQGADVLFVGHEPTMSQTISTITGGSSVVMKPGSLARVDVIAKTNLSGELVWLITPDVFGAVAK